MKLFARFFLILLAFSFLPVAGMGLWSLQRRQAVRDSARSLHSRLAALTAEVAERTAEQLNRSLIVVEDVERARGDAGLEQAALRRAAASDSQISLLSLLDREGVEGANLSDPEDFPILGRVDRSSEPAVARCRSTGRVALGEAIRVGGHPAVPAAHPLSDGRTLYMIYSLRGLERRLARISQAEAGLKLLFVDSLGRPVPGLGDPPPGEGWTLPSGGSWLDRVEGAGGPWAAASAPVEALGWRAVSLQPRREAYAEDRAQAARTAAFFAAVCLLVGGGAWGLSERLLRPIRALISGAERVSRGDFAKPVPRLGWGELDRLGETFNAMAAQVLRYQQLQIDKIMEEKAKVDALVRNIPEGVLMTSFDGTVLYLNATAARILDVGPVERAARVSDLVRSPQLKKLIDSIQAGAKKAEGAVVEMRGAKDAISVYSCRAMTVVRDSKEIGILVLMRDITMEREIERMKEDFFHAIIHDLRGPITVIDGIVHFMKKLPDLGTKEKAYVGLAEQASKRLGALVANILDIAKLESGTMKMTQTKTGVDPLLQSVRALYQVPAEGKGVGLELESPSGLELRCDPPLVERVLMNLLGNALKFTPAGGRITLGARAEGPDVEFWVRDTGPGIPADKLDAVFQKFQQLDRDAGSRAGYGLGLSICRKIVEIHHGSIWVESKEGEGSRFAFRVPQVGVNPRA